jgi:hypothetical protein
MVVVLLRLHRAYDREAALLSASPTAAPLARAAKNIVVVLVDSVDLAVIRAIRYARTLRPSQLRVVHFVLDSTHATALLRAWDEQPGLDLPLELVDCPDRRLPRAALELVERTLAQEPGATVTVLLPRRSYGALLGRLLHDRTADDIAGAVSHVRGAAATIVPFDASTPTVVPWRRETPAPPTVHRPVEAPTDPRREAASRVGVAADSRVAIADAPHRGKAVVQGRVRSVEVSPMSGSPALKAELCDESGGLTLLFYGRRSIPGIEPGTVLRAEGRVGEYKGHIAMSNPMYRLLPRDGDGL